MSTLVYSQDGSSVSIEGVVALDPGVTLNGLNRAIREARLVVVEDILSFPFEWIPANEIPTPVSLRMPRGLGPAATRKIVGDEVLGSLTRCDLVVGCTGDAWSWLNGTLAPAQVLKGDMSTEAFVGQSRRHAAALATMLRSPLKTPLPLQLGTPEKNATGAVRRARTRMTRERTLLRAGLVRAAADQPSMRRMRIAVVAPHPSHVSPALPTGADWVAVPLVPDSDQIPEGVEAAPPTPSLRLGLEASKLDVVCVVADLMNSSLQSLQRVFGEFFRILRPGGTLMLITDVVGDGDARPLEVEELIGTVARSGGRAVLLEDVQTMSHPDHSNRAMFTWRKLGGQQ